VTVVRKSAATHVAMAFMIVPALQDMMLTPVLLDLPHLSIYVIEIDVKVLRKSLNNLNISLNSN